MLLSLSLSLSVCFPVVLARPPYHLRRMKLGPPETVIKRALSVCCLCLPFLLVSVCFWLPLSVFVCWATVANVEHQNASWTSRPQKRKGWSTNTRALTCALTFLLRCSCQQTSYLCGRTTKKAMVSAPRTRFASPVRELGDEVLSNLRTFFPQPAHGGQRHVSHMLPCCAALVFITPPHLLQAAVRASNGLQELQRHSVITSTAYFLCCGLGLPQPLQGGYLQGSNM